MLDVEFLRSLGIKEELLPEPGLEGKICGENVATDDLPPAGEAGVPPEIWQLSDEELANLLDEKHSQDNPYRYKTPKGHVIAVYPQAGEGRYDIEMTAEEFKNLLLLNKRLGGRTIAYETKDGVRVPW